MFRYQIKQNMKQKVRSVSVKSLVLSYVWWWCKDCIFFLNINSSAEQ